MAQTRPASAFAALAVLSKVGEGLAPKLLFEGPCGRSLLCLVLNAGDRWGDVTLSDERPTGAPLDNVYMGVVSDESGVLQGIKFPDVD